MNISELIAKLEEMRALHGDILVAVYDNEHDHHDPVRVVEYKEARVNDRFWYGSDDPVLGPAFIQLDS